MQWEGDAVNVAIYGRDSMTLSTRFDVVLIYRNWPPYRCAVEQLPSEGDHVFYENEECVVVDRKYTLPMHGRPETWLRLERA